MCIDYDFVFSPDFFLKIILVFHPYVCVATFVTFLSPCIIVHAIIIDHALKRLPIMHQRTSRTVIATVLLRGQACPKSCPVVYVTSYYYVRHQRAAIILYMHWTQCAIYSGGRMKKLLRSPIYHVHNHC